MADVVRRNVVQQDQSIVGMCTSTPFAKTLALSTNLPVERLLTISSMRAIPAELEDMYKNIQRTTLIKRVNSCEDYIGKHLNNEYNIAGFMPPLTLTVRKATLKRSDNPNEFDTLIFNPSDVFIVDGVGRATTMMRMLGDFPTRIDNRGSKTTAFNEKREIRRELVRNYLREMDIPVTFVIAADKEKGLTNKDIGQIFGDINFNQQKVTNRHAMKVTHTDVIVNFARDFGQLDFILKIGGMSENDNSVSKKSKHILTLNIISRFIRGAIGGTLLQTKDSGALEIPNSGREINSDLIDEVRVPLMTFFTAWVKAQGDDFSKERSDFRHQTTIIQALGLAYYTLSESYSSTLSKSEFIEKAKEAGEKLGDLGYSKFDKHWAKCKVMGLKAKGYSNITGGGKTYREGIAAYFCSELGLSGHAQNLVK